MNGFNISAEYLYGSNITITENWFGAEKMIRNECDIIYFLIDGECEIEIDGTLYAGRKGDAFFIGRNVPHKYRLTDMHLLSKYWFHIKADYNENSLFEELSLPPFYHFDNFDEANAKFMRLAELTYNVGIMGQIEWTGALMDVLSYTYRMAGCGSTTSKKEEMGDVVKYMNDNLSNHVTVEQLAQIAHLQPNYFIKKFRSQFGMSPIQYINRKKFEIIEAYLSCNDTPIAEIMKKTGFDDIAYFSHFFKKYTGYSPQKYREAAKSKNRSLRKD